MFSCGHLPAANYLGEPAYVVDIGLQAHKPAEQHILLKPFEQLPPRANPVESSSDESSSIFSGSTEGRPSDVHNFRKGVLRLSKVSYTIFLDPWQRMPGLSSQAGILTEAEISSSCIGVKIPD